MILRGPEIYHAAACLIMVCSSLLCAMVRYFHMCRPFDEHEEYFYPARKLITFVYACFVMPAVWLFRMDSSNHQAEKRKNKISVLLFFCLFSYLCSKRASASPLIINS